MDVLEAVYTRHSYRGKYKCIPVPGQDLVEILV